MTINVDFVQIAKSMTRCWADLSHPSHECKNGNILFEALIISVSGFVYNNSNNTEKHFSVNYLLTKNVLYGVQNIFQYEGIPSLDHFLAEHFSYVVKDRNMTVLTSSADLESLKIERRVINDSFNRADINNIRVWPIMAEINRNDDLVNIIKD